MIMADVIIVGGFSGYGESQSFALESPFLLKKDGVFCDVPGLYRLFIDPELEINPTDVDSPPFVCYALKQLLHNQEITSEMIFYLDAEIVRMKSIFLSNSRSVIFLSTTLISSSLQVLNAIKIIRQYAPDNIILCGGPLVDRSFLIQNILQQNHASIYEPCKADHFFLGDSNDCPTYDKVIFVISDHELSVASRIVHFIQRGNEWKSIYKQFQNSAVLIEHQWQISNEVVISSSILPVINWNIFTDDEIRFSAPIIRSRGCPNRCRFCSFHSLSKYIEKDAGQLKYEIDTLMSRSMRPDFLTFCDDNICYNRFSINSFADTMISLEYGIKWNSFFDARFIDMPMAEKLIQSGCNLLKIGMESADDTILRAMKKPSTTKHYKQAIAALGSVGISVDAYFIVGFPGETTETISSTIDTINSFEIPKFSVNQFMFFPFILAPMSPVFKKNDRDQYQLDGYMRNWKHYTMDSDTAVKMIPNIIQNIITMQPEHGNVEKMLVLQKSTLAQIDLVRGGLIRNRLANGIENDSDWDALKSLIATFKLSESKYRQLPLFV